MSDIKEEAILNYTGAEGRARRNCARAVSDACSANYPLDSAELARLNSCGGGRAPRGVCGALYTAELIASKYHAESAGSIGARFETLSGSVFCHQIRSTGRIPCAQCVGNAGSIIDQLKNGG